MATQTELKIAKECLGMLRLYEATGDYPIGMPPKNMLMLAWLCTGTDYPKGQRGAKIAISDLESWLKEETP